MKSAVLALSIFLSVSALVALYAWDANRRYAPVLDAAAKEALEAKTSPQEVDGFAAYPVPRYSPLHLRIVIASFAISLASLSLGIVLLNRRGAIHAVGVALIAVGLAAHLIRIVLRINAARAARRMAISKLRGQDAG